MNFWDVHGVIGGLFFLFFLAFLPRVTLMFISLLLGAIGITFWGVIGWIFVPRILVAIIATTVYWDTNPVLSVLSWIVALCGEGAEKTVVKNKASD